MRNRVPWRITRGHGCLSAPRRWGWRCPTGGATAILAMRRPRWLAPRAVGACGFCCAASAVSGAIRPRRSTPAPKPRRGGGAGFSCGPDCGLSPRHPPDGIAHIVGYQKRPVLQGDTDGPTVRGLLVRRQEIGQNVARRARGFAIHERHEDDLVA